MKPSLCLLLPLVLLGRLHAATFTPAAAVPRALAENRELAAARLAVTEATERLNQSGRLSDPELETTLLPNVNGKEGKWSAGLTQRFPLTARLRLERAVSRRDVEVAQAEVRQAERRLATEVNLEVIDWLTLEARRALHARQLTNSQHLAQLTAQAAKAGEISSLEAGQLELESLELAGKLNLLQQEQVPHVANLRRWLNVPPPEPLEISGPLPAPLLIPPSATNSLHPDVFAATTQLERARDNVELARASRWHDVGVGIVGEAERLDDQPQGRRNDQFIGLRFQLPLPLWSRTSAKVREATATEQRRKLELEAMILRQEVEQESARTALTSALAADQNFTEVQLPAAQRLEERFTQARTEGLGTASEIIRVREKRLQLELTQLEVRREALRAQIRLQAALGLPPSLVAPQP